MHLSLDKNIGDTLAGMVRNRAPHEAGQRRPGPLPGRAHVRATSRTKAEGVVNAGTLKRWLDKAGF